MKASTDLDKQIEALEEELREKTEILKRMKEEKKNRLKKQICVSISEEDLELLRNHCERTGCTMSGLLHVWIRDKLPK